MAREIHHLCVHAYTIMIIITIIIVIMIITREIPMRMMIRTRILQNNNNNNWLVVSIPLKNICSSIGMMTFPVYGKMFQTTNQIYTNHRLIID